MARVKILQNVYARGEVRFRRDEIADLVGGELAMAVRRAWAVELPAVPEPTVEKPAADPGAKNGRKGS